MIDAAASGGLLAAAALLFAAYSARRRAVHARVAKDGGSALLGQGTMNAAYWALAPIARACARAGVTANEITVGSLVLAFAAGALLAVGHFGLAALVTVVASLCDALDGLVAREAGTASASGEVLDAAVDRYSELFFLGGLAVHFRASAAALVLTLGAVLASFMVSYATAKAEALQVAAPRGAMRRAERAAYLALGVTLAPLAALAAARVRPDPPWWACDAPILAAVALVAVAGNVSAARRLAAVARAVAPADARPVRRRGSVALTLGRHQIGAMIATVVDFGTMTLLVEAGGATPVQATLVGASCGAVTNFVLGRIWVFEASNASAAPQAIRYALVSGTSALLNASGEYLVHDTLGVQYVAARAVVAIAVSLAWNFPMQRFFVFRATRSEP